MESKKYPLSLGIDSNSGDEIFIKKGPYGFYIQNGNDNVKAKKISIQKDVESIDLEYAMKLLSLPRTLGSDASGNIIKTSIGKFGPYLFIDNKYISLKGTHYDPAVITLNEAIEVIQSKNQLKNTQKVKKSMKENKNS